MRPILKHMHNPSDEVVCERWVENPYFQLFCGEEFLQHRLTFDRSSLTHSRQRMGDEKLVAVIRESPATATRTSAAKPSDFSKLIIDTTVQEKAIAFPTDARLMHRARHRLVRLPKKHGVGLRQSYERIGKHALIAHQRYEYDCELRFRHCPFARRHSPFFLRQVQHEKKKLQRAFVGGRGRELLGGIWRSTTRLRLSYR